MKHFSTLVGVHLGCLALLGSVQAGVFGPSNEHECVLEKMKGQDRAMIGVARAACAEQFPEEVQLQEGVNIKSGQIASSWCDTNSDSVEVCLDKNETQYKITKVSVTLWDVACDQMNSIPIEVEALPAMFGNKFKAKVPGAKSYKCMKTSWYGIKKK